MGKREPPSPAIFSKFWHRQEVVRNIFSLLHAVFLATSPRPLLYYTLSTVPSLRPGPSGPVNDRGSRRFPKLKIPLKKILLYSALVLLGLVNVFLVCRLMLNLSAVGHALSSVVGALAAPFRAGLRDGLPALPSDAVCRHKPHRR